MKIVKIVKMKGIHRKYFLGRFFNEPNFFTLIEIGERVLNKNFVEFYISPEDECLKKRIDALLQLLQKETRHEAGAWIRS
jgi:hypothetical protein